MKIIDDMVESLEEEVEGAMEYAERFIECKARGDSNRSNRYREMATDELKHAGYLRDMNISDVDELKRIYTFTDAEESAWKHGNKVANEKMAVVKQMLSL